MSGTRLRGVLTITVVLTFLLLATIAAAAFAPGDKVEVLWKGKWYKATVLKVDGDRNFIHYDGYESSWDEWVGPDRIRVAGGAATAGYAVGDKVTVEWKGKWYPAQVLEAKDGKWKIHYDGYESSWDEWVGPERIKPR